MYTYTACFCLLLLATTALATVAPFPAALLAAPATVAILLATILPATIRCYTMLGATIANAC